MPFNQIALIPLATVTLAFSAFFAGYGIAVGNNHVDPWIPFISDCGAMYPERLVFGQLLNSSVLCLILVMYLNHRKIMTFYDESNMEIGRWKGFSRFVLLVGWVSAFGGSMVANFSESDQIVVHSIGAFMFFIGITLYFWGLLFINYSLRPKMVPIHLTNFRLFLTFSTSLILIFHLICLFVQPFVVRTNGKLPDKPDWPHNIERPNATSPFYTNHVAAASSEWALAVLIFFGILSFSFEFATTVYHAPRLSSTNPKDNVSSDMPIINQKETRLTHYDGFAPYSPYAQLTVPEHYSETLSTTRRLPRVDNLYSGTGYSGRTNVNGGTTYNGSYSNAAYTHY